MEPRYRGIDGQPSPRIPHSSGFNFFPEQARRVVHMRPEIRPTRHEHFRDLPHHFHPYPRHIPHPAPYPPPQPHDMNEAIRREIEKERIREEIIISEVARRRALEEEVRRELMMERELALCRDKDGIPFGLSPVRGFDSPMRLSLLGPRAEGRSLEDRIASSVEEMGRLSGRGETGGLETLPFQRGTADGRVSEVKPVAEGNTEKEKIILLAKPDINISGSKRKAVTPPEVDTSELLSDSILHKKAKEEWSCALCQVSTTSEQGLNEHLKGKKHKSKEEALRAQRSGKNYSIGLFAKKATKPIQVAGEGGVKIVTESLPFKESDEASSVKDDQPPLQENYSIGLFPKKATKPIQVAGEGRVKIVTGSLPFKETDEASLVKDDQPPLQENPNSDKLEKKLPELVHKEGKDVYPKKEQFRHWCEICQVGTFSSKVMNTHKRGRKHRNRLGKSDQRGKTGQHNKEEEKIAVVVYHVEEEVAENDKNITLENVYEASDEVSSEDPKPMNALKAEDHGPLDAIKVEVSRELYKTKPEPLDATNAEEGGDHGPLDEIKVEVKGELYKTKPEPLDATNAGEGGDVEITKPEDGELNITKAEEGGNVDITKHEDDSISNVFELNNDELILV